MQSLHPWQAFTKLFWSDLKARVYEEWKEYQEVNPEANHSCQAHFKFHNKKMKEWYEEADSEKKERVEEFWQNSKGDLLEGGDKDPNCISKSELSISFFSHTYVVLGILINCLAL